MKYRIITISRESGSGGRTIGREVARNLGLLFYDKKIISQINEKRGFTTDTWATQRQIIMELAEKAPCLIVGQCADYILKDRRDCLNVFIHASMKKRTERIIMLSGENSAKAEQHLIDKDRCRRACYKLYTDTEWGNAGNYHISLDSGEFGIETCIAIIENLYDT